jgi:hypothetical protein
MTENARRLIGGLTVTPDESGLPRPKPNLSGEIRSMAIDRRAGRSSCGDRHACGKQRVSDHFTKFGCILKISDMLYPVRKTSLNSWWG